MIDTFLPLVDIAFPTFDDERLLTNHTALKDVVARYQSFGIEEIVLKNGGDGCWVINGADVQLVPVVDTVSPTDTTAAGDSFNAAYLAARISGNNGRQAARFAHTVAAEVIQQPGAITAIEHTDPSAAID